MVDGSTVDLSTPAPWHKFIKKEDREAANLTDRQKIIYEALDECEAAFADRKSGELIDSDESKQYEAYIKDLLTMTSAFCPGFETSMFKEFRTKFTEHMPKINNRIDTATKVIDRVDGMDIVFMRTLTPAVVSNRVLFICQAQFECEDGSVMVVMSSKGNEKYAESMANDIYWDVVADQPFSFTKFTPCEGGCMINQLITMNPNGWIPDWVT